QAISMVSECDISKPVFLFINISAIHQPNYFYCDNQTSDDLCSHGGALRYVDSQLPPLFEFFGKRRDTLFILCSDHGSCYGEGGYNGHRLAHEAVWTVPYTEFIQEKQQ
ncbi:MAG: sulfatase-like hydrolase/transferase, partial [Psychrosphaera sp.]|nr:sulfatase-like hydrolase/transferase [Psychrosphaera sp.]